MKKTTLTIVLALLCLFKMVRAQEHKIDHTPLKLGDSIPEAIWNTPLQVINHPLGNQTITLNDYRGSELIIIDFWASNCSPCIKSLNKLDTLEKHFPKMSVVPVFVYDLLPNAMPTIIRHKWKWPSVVNSTLFNMQLFSRYITGFGNVWIYRGRLLAIPRPNNITKENIGAVLSNKHVAFQNLQQLF